MDFFFFWFENVKIKASVKLVWWCCGLVFVIICEWWQGCMAWQAPCDGAHMTGNEGWKTTDCRGTCHQRLTFRGSNFYFRVANPRFWWNWCEALVLDKSLMMNWWFFFFFFFRNRLARTGRKSFYYWEIRYKNPMNIRRNGVHPN